MFAFDFNVMVIIKDDGLPWVFQQHQTKPEYKITEYALSRLGQIGYKVINQNVSSVEEAREIVEAARKKNYRIVY